MWRVLFPLHMKLAAWSMTWFLGLDVASSDTLCTVCSYVCKEEPGAFQVKEGVGSEGGGSISTKCQSPHPGEIASTFLHTSGIWALWLRAGTWDHYRQARDRDGSQVW